VLITCDSSTTAGPPRFQARTADIGGLQISYDERVLEPRPWTALQGMWAAELARSLPDGPILELCSGAGHIGLVAASRCDRPLVQVDASAVACAFARANADRAGLGSRVEVHCLRIEEVPLSPSTYPLVIADPPYLARRDIGRFPEDPPSAVDGGEDGLVLVRACLDVIGAVLAPDGVALLQLGSHQHVRDVGGLAPDGLLVTDHKSDRGDRHVVMLQRQPTASTGDATGPTRRGYVPA